MVCSYLAWTLTPLSLNTESSIVAEEDRATLSICVTFLVSVHVV